MPLGPRCLLLPLVIGSGAVLITTPRPESSKGFEGRKPQGRTHSELLVRRESGLLLNLKDHDREHAHVIAHEAAFASCALIRQADRLEVSI